MTYHIPSISFYNDTSRTYRNHITPYHLCHITFQITPNYIYITYIAPISNISHHFILRTSQAHHTNVAYNHTHIKYSHFDILSHWHHPLSHLHHAHRNQNQSYNPISCHITFILHFAISRPYHTYITSPDFDITSHSS